MKLFENFFIIILYIFFAKLGHLMAIGPGNISAIWPPAGITMTAAILRGRSIYPGIFIAAFLGNTFFYYTKTTFPLVFVAGYLNGLGDLLCAHIGRFFILKKCGTRFPFNSPWNVTHFLLFAGLLGPFISAILGVGGLSIVGLISPHDILVNYITWHVGDSAGVIMIAPFLLSLQEGFTSKTLKFRNWNRWKEVILYFSFIILLISLSFDFCQFSLSLPLVMLMPVHVWAIHRLDIRVPFFSTILISFISILSIENYDSPFRAEDSNKTLINLQLYLISMTLTIYYLSGFFLKNLENQQQLKKKNQEIKAFAYAISHDLQEPLRSLNIYFSLFLKHQRKLHPKAREYLNKASIQIERMGNLIIKILEFSKVDKEIEINPVNLTYLVNEVINSLTALVQEKGAKITFYNLPTIFSNEPLIYSLMQNLISNALKFHRNEVPPHIEIIGKKKSNSFTIQVKDNGIGLAPNHYKDIFLPFKHLNRQGEYQGAGIGLSTCKKIVEKLGGTIKVESIQGEGTSFFVNLPCNE